MGFLKYLKKKTEESRKRPRPRTEKRLREMEAKDIYERERKLEYEQAKRRGELAGTRKAGYKAGLRKSRAQQMGWQERMANVSVGLERMLDPTGQFTGKQKKKSTTRRKKRGTTILVDGTAITISKAGAKKKKRKKQADEWIW